MAGSSPPNDRGHHGSDSSRHRIRLLCSENQPSTGKVWDTPLYRDVLSNHPTLFSASQNGEMGSRGRKCLGSMAKKAFLIFTPRTFENPPSLPSPLYFLSPTSHPPSLIPHPSSPKFGCSILLTPQDCHKLLNHECAFFFLHLLKIAISRERSLLFVLRQSVAMCARLVVYSWARKMLSPQTPM